MTYLPAGVEAAGDSPAVIYCTRGIPFRLKLVDEKGEPVDAEVTYYDVTPNSFAPRAYCYPCYKPLNRAAKQADGTYCGVIKSCADQFVRPGAKNAFGST
jgi:hypothetical protein